MQNHPNEPLKEWFALDYGDGVFPPGLWAVAGRWRGECGVFLGVCGEVLKFIPQSRIAEAIADLKRQGEVTLAGMVEEVSGDVEVLRTGREKLACDLAGRRFR